jgi:hypothetical protein
MLYDLISTLLRPVGWWGRLQVRSLEVVPEQYARFPRRPRVRVSFFPPENGDPRPDETPAEVATRLLDQIRARVPPTPAGRRARVGGSPRVRRARARRASRS